MVLHDTRTLYSYYPLQISPTVDNSGNYFLAFHTDADSQALERLIENDESIIAGDKNFVLFSDIKAAEMFLAEVNDIFGEQRSYNIVKIPKVVAMERGSDVTGYLAWACSREDHSMKMVALPEVVSQRFPFLDGLFFNINRRPLVQEPIAQCERVAEPAL